MTILVFAYNGTEFVIDKREDRENRDLKEIINGLARAANGDFSTKIRLSGNNVDFAAIVKSFNEMIREIRNAADDTRDSYCDGQELSPPRIRDFVG